MPSILSRFKRSPSTSSAHSEDPATPHTDTTRPISISAQTPKSQFTESGRVSPTSSSTGGTASSFVEVFDDGRGGIEKHRPAPLAVPLAIHTNGGVLGTPKLVLTAEGSNSPISVIDSPASRGSPVPTRGLGLGSDYQTSKRRVSLHLVNQCIAYGSQSGTLANDDIETPTAHTENFDYATMGHATPQTAPPVMNSTTLEPTSTTRDRSNSTTSSTTQHSHSRAASLIERLKPTGDDTSLLQKVKTKRRKHRALSNSSSHSHPIANVLAKGGIHLPTSSDGDLLRVNSGRKGSVNRSKYLSGGPEGSLSVEDGDSGVMRLDDEEDEDDDSDSEGEHLPVTGFAVASNRRQGDFHQLFATVDEGDYLIEGKRMGHSPSVQVTHASIDYGCALSKDILVQGRLYISENHLCFHANIFGWTTDVSQLRSVLPHG
jgi:hypothetical protein